MELGSEIRKKPIPDPGSGSRVKKAPNPGSGSATLLLRDTLAQYITFK